jgi:endogenous inhibitor of DNA gyrase (YacG/DUF329 family)
MGMFDRIWATCPECGTGVEFQSKAGECVLHDYSRTEVPPEIAHDIDQERERCPQCDTIVQLYIEDEPPKTIWMKVRKLATWD